MTKTLNDIKKEIDLKEWYRPSQISNYRWMLGYQGKNAYFYILELIKLGKLKAKNFGKGKTPYYRILGSDLIEYLDNI